MAMTIPVVKVESNRLYFSVGRGGKNLDDDIEFVKRMLNKISPENGGASGTLDETDLSPQGMDFELMVYQIHVFQAINFPEMLNGKRNPQGFASDGLIEPERSTIKRMKALMALRSGGSTTVGLAIRPDTPITEQCNGFGFSAAKLQKKYGERDWSQRNPLGMATQFIPAGGKRVLVFDTTPANDPFNASIADESKAIILDKNGSRVTIKGIKAGTTTLWITSESGGRQIMALVVRPEVTLKIDMLHIGAQSTFATAIANMEMVIPVLNQIYLNQANIKFEWGVKENMKEMQTSWGILNLTGRPMVISNSRGVLDPSVDVVSWADLKRLKKNLTSITLLTHEAISDSDSTSIIGEALVREKIAWVNFTAPAFLPSLVAHEIGHSLGLAHITAAKNKYFLMQPIADMNTLIIPSDTLSDLIL
jgi:hypothetical protein